MMPPPAPPPAPPPTVPQFLELKKDGRSRKTPCLITHETSDELCQKDFRDRLNKIIYKHEALKSKQYVYLSLQRIVPALLQDGPQCGIIALAMAHKILGFSTVDVANVMTRAIQNKYTLQGEMFSAFNMSRLADEIYDCKSEILDMKCDSSRDRLIQYLLRGLPVLVPYDADFNHEPCKKKGHKAHWALLTGMLIVIDMQKNRTIDNQKQQNEVNSDYKFLKNPNVPEKTQSVITDTTSLETGSLDNNDFTSPVEDTSLDLEISDTKTSSSNPEPEDDTDSAQPLVDIQIALPDKTGTSKSSAISEEGNKPGTSQVTGILEQVTKTDITQFTVIQEQTTNLVISRVGLIKNFEVQQTDFQDSYSLVGDNCANVCPADDYDISSFSSYNEHHILEAVSQNVSLSDTMVILKDSEENCASEDVCLPDINIDPIPPVILLESSDRSSVTKLSQNLQTRIDGAGALQNVDQVSLQSCDRVSSVAVLSNGKLIQDNGANTTSSTLDIGYGSTNQNTYSVSPLLDIGIDSSIQNCETDYVTVDLLNASHIVPRHSLDKVSPLADFGIYKPENNLSLPATNSDSTSPLLDTAVTSSSNENPANSKTMNLKIGENSVDGVNYVSLNCDETFPIEDVYLSDVENLRGKSTLKNTSLTDLEQILQELSVKDFSTPNVKFLIQDREFKQLYHIDPDLCDQADFHPVEYSNIYVYACQGKSRRQAIWPLELLLESNGNLIEIGPERTQESELYVLPSEGIDKELCNKIIVLKK